MQRAGRSRIEIHWFPLYLHERCLCDGVDCRRCRRYLYASWTILSCHVDTNRRAWRHVYRCRNYFGDVTWLGAFFHSVSSRTAGFSTYPLGTFSTAGLLVLTVLMFIGASPGSTGGGIKTSTFFVIIQGIISAATNKSEKAFQADCFGPWWG